MMKRLFNWLTPFLEGMCSLNLFPQTLPDPFNGKTDEQLLEEDWKAIGEDLRKAFPKGFMDDCEK